MHLYRKGFQFRGKDLGRGTAIISMVVAFRSIGVSVIVAASKILGAWAILSIVSNFIHVGRKNISLLHTIEQMLAHGFLSLKILW